jgi:hypothetical protein
MLEKKVYALSNGNTVTFTRNPPFGFWNISYGKGMLPAHLAGMYMGLGGAKRAFESYIGFKKISMKEEVNRPTTKEGICPVKQET